MSISSFATLADTFLTREDFLSSVWGHLLLKIMLFLYKGQRETNRFFSIVIEEASFMIDAIFFVAHKRSKTGSRLISCPLKFGRIMFTKILNASHNHGPSSDISKHPTSCCFFEVEAFHVKEPYSIFRETKKSQHLSD